MRPKFDSSVPSFIQGEILRIFFVQQPENCKLIQQQSIANLQISFAKNSICVLWYKTILVFFKYYVVVWLHNCSNILFVTNVGYL